MFSTHKPDDVWKGELIEGKDGTAVSGYESFELKEWLSRSWRRCGKEGGEMIGRPKFARERGCFIGLWEVLWSSSSEDDEFFNDGDEVDLRIRGLRSMSLLRVTSMLFKTLLERYTFLTVENATGGNRLRGKTVLQKDLWLHLQPLSRDPDLASGQLRCWNWISSSAKLLIWACCRCCRRRRRWRPDDDDGGRGKRR